MKKLKAKDIKHHAMFKCGLRVVFAIGDFKPERMGWVTVCPFNKRHTFDSRLENSFNVRASELEELAV